MHNTSNLEAVVIYTHTHSQWQHWHVAGTSRVCLIKWPVSVHTQFAVSLQCLNCPKNKKTKKTTATKKYWPQIVWYRDAAPKNSSSLFWHSVCNLLRMITTVFRSTIWTNVSKNINFFYTEVRGRACGQVSHCCVALLISCFFQNCTTQCAEIRPDK